MIRHNYRFSLFLALLCALNTPVAYAQKLDTVVLVNGNAVTGEVKSLEFGRLRYSTDSMGTVSIDWEDIVNVSSPQTFQVELTDGTRYFGRLLATDRRFHIEIDDFDGNQVIESPRVVRITPIETEQSFFERLEGSFSFGIQTQKSSGVTTSNLAADVSYRARAYLVGLRLNSSTTAQPNEPDTARQALNTNYQRFRPNRWFTDWFTGWEKNDELGIASRVSLGGALGRYLIQNNNSQFSLAAGVQGARSTFTGDDEPTTEAEGRIEVRYQHRSLVPEGTFTFTSRIYPLLEDLAQYRAESDLSLRRELWEDLFWDLTIGFSYLSNPPSDAVSTDYTATTSLGYSW